MAVTLVLHLLRGPLAQDELVGHAEIVATSESRVIRSVDDLLTVARAASTIAGSEDGSMAAGTRPQDAPAAQPSDEGAP